MVLFFSMYYFFIFLFCDVCFIRVFLWIDFNLVFCLLPRVKFTFLFISSNFSHIRRLLQFYLHVNHVFFMLFCHNIPIFCSCLRSKFILFSTVFCGALCSYVRFYTLMLFTVSSCFMLNLALFMFDVVLYVLFILPPSFRTHVRAVRPRVHLTAARIFCATCRRSSTCPATTRRRRALAGGIIRRPSVALSDEAVDHAS